jgi:hypothetical protein
VVAFTLALEPASVRDKKLLDLWSEGRDHSRSHLDQLVPVARELKRNR